MIPLLVGGLVGFVIWHQKTKGETQRNRVDRAVSIGISTIAGMFLGFCVALFLSITYQEWEVVNTRQLVSMNNQSRIEGSFIFGTGRIGEEVTYSYWYSEGDAYRYGEISEENNDVFIFEEDRTDGTYYKIEQRCSSYVSLWTLCPPGETKFEFHVPKGTVVTDFVLE